MRAPLAPLCHAPRCTVPFEGLVPTQDINLSRECCSLCQLLWSGAETYVGSLFPEVFDNFGFNGRREGDTGPFRVDLVPSKWGFNATYVQKLKLQYYVAQGTLHPFPEIGEAHEVGLTGLSESTIGLAEQWIDSCIHAKDRHLKCHFFDETTARLPARVLDLGLNDDIFIKLHISREGETGRYVALSHCWGGKTPAMTTAHNFQDHLREIPQPLPQTFEDAVLVTRKLGIRYLWIDSLCIVQDSSEDWAIHAPQMAQVYGNSYITISADAAKDSTEGFLGTGKRAKSTSKAIPFTYDGHESVVFVRERGALAYQLPYHVVSDPTEPSTLSKKELQPILSRVCRWPHTPASKLSTRGWVFQERILSPRTLHFSEAETGWECRSLINCECSATSTRRKRTTCLLKRAVIDMPWTEVIQEYTRLQLTVKRDRLVALSGLAEARYNLQKDQYVAGLWKKDLKQQLLWSTGRPGARLDIAPTWSWASVTDSVNYNHHNSPILSLPDDPRESAIGQWDIISVSCGPVGGSTFSTCESGANLLVLGSIIPIEIKERVLCFQTTSLGPKGTQIPFNVYCDVHIANPNDFLIGKREYVLFMTSHPPHAPQGLVLLGDRNTVEAGETVGSFERAGFASARRPVEERDWSDDTSEEEEMEVVPVQMWNWDLWEASSKLQKFRIY